MNKWETETCFGCKQSFTEMEWYDAHTAHDIDCGVWVGKFDECKCTRHYHASCCPDCTGQKAKEANVKFAHIPTNKMITDFLQFVESVHECELALAARKFLPADDPDVPSMDECQKALNQARQFASLLSELLELRGIDIRKLLGGEESE